MSYGSAQNGGNWRAYRDNIDFPEEAIHNVPKLLDAEWPEWPVKPVGVTFEPDLASTERFLQTAENGAAYSVRFDDWYVPPNALDPVIPLVVQLWPHCDLSRCGLRSLPVGAFDCISLTLTCGHFYG